MQAQSKVSNHEMPYRILTRFARNPALSLVIACAYAAIIFTAFSTQYVDRREVLFCTVAAYEPGNGRVILHSEEELKIGEWLFIKHKGNGIYARGRATEIKSLENGVVQVTLSSDQLLEAVSLDHIEIYRISGKETVKERIFQ